MRIQERRGDRQTEGLRLGVLDVHGDVPIRLPRKRGLDPRGVADQREAEGEDPGLPSRSQGCTGAAEEQVVARRVVAMKAKFRIEGDGRLYTTKPGAGPVHVTCAPVIACRACKIAGRGVKHRWFHEFPGFN